MILFPKLLAFAMERHAIALLILIVVHGGVTISFWGSDGVIVFILIVDDAGFAGDEAQQAAAPSSSLPAVASALSPSSAGAAPSSSLSSSMNSADLYLPTGSLLRASFLFFFSRGRSSS